MCVVQHHENVVKSCWWKIWHNEFLSIVVLNILFLTRGYTASTDKIVKGGDKRSSRNFMRVLSHPQAGVYMEIRLLILTHFYLHIHTCMMYNVTVT